MSRPRPQRVLVLGAGFAGLAAATALPTSLRVSVIDRSRWFEFLPNIHELVSGVKTPQLLRLPADTIVRRAGHRFVKGMVEAIDWEARQVHVGGRRPLAYDLLIVALGGVNATHGVKGVESNALPFKSVDDCVRIRRRLEELARRRGRSDLVIVGGGLEGVEALGEVLRRWRDEDRFRIRLVEAQGRLLPEAPASLDRAVRRLCRESELEFVTGTRVSEVAVDHVRLSTGRRLPAQAVVWTGGPAPPPLLAAAGLARDGAWAPVDECLRSRHAERVLVVGDAAELPAPVSKQAYHALDMGRHAAETAARVLAGRSPRPFVPAGKPTLVAFGDLSTFLVAGRHALSGPALGAAKEGVYELVMAQLDRRSWSEAAPAMGARLLRAGRELVWPGVCSPASLARGARLSLLA